MILDKHLILLLLETIRKFGHSLKPLGMNRSAASTDTDGATRLFDSRQCICSRNSIITCITFVIFTTSTAKATLPHATTPPFRKLNGLSPKTSYAQSGLPSVRTRTFQIVPNMESPLPLLHLNTSRVGTLYNGLFN